MRDDLLNSHWDIPLFVLKRSLNLSVTAKNVTSSKAWKKNFFFKIICTYRKFEFDRILDK